MAQIRLLVLICFVFSGSANAEQVGCLEFPTLTSELSVTAEENAAITLPFRLLVDNPTCPKLGDSTSFVYVNSPSKASFCVVRVSDGGACLPVFNTKHCHCTSGDGFEGSSFALTKTATGDDFGTWTWKVGQTSSEMAAVFFDIASTGGESEDTRETEHPKPTNQEHGKSAANTPAGKSPSQVERTPGNSIPKASNQQKTRNTQNSAKATPEVKYPKAARPEEREESQVITATTDDTVSATRDDSEGGTPPGGWAVFGGVFVAVNIVTIIAVATTVYVLKGRRERRRRRPDSSLPPTPKNKTAKGGNRSQGTGRPGKSAPTSSYIEIESCRPLSRKYEEIPAVFPAVTNGGYEVPVITARQQLTMSGYEAIF